MEESGIAKEGVGIVCEDLRRDCVREALILGWAYREQDACYMRGGYENYLIKEFINSIHYYLFKKIV